MIFSRTEKLFLLFAMISGFLICGEYAMTRPTSNALFLTVFSAKGYPWVWLAIVPLNLAVVYLYNRWLPQKGPRSVLTLFAALVILINTLTGLFYTQWPAMIFFQYAWKDIYVLLMLKQLWSMIHSTIPSNRAKYLYGCIYGVGTLGAILGSLIPATFATQWGAEKILCFTLPLYLLLIGTYTLALRYSGVQGDTFQHELTDNPRPREAIALIRRTPILIGALSLVILMQVSVGLMEYQFNAHLEQNILEKDLRAAYCGRLMSMVNCCSLVFQFLGGFLMVRTLGLRGSHVLVPTLLGASAICSWVLPSFALISFSYVFLKAMDFSLFGVIREMLYVPLQLDAKFRAKAIIDVFAYRTSKALVSLGLLLLQAVAGAALLPLTGLISIAIFIGWLAVVALIYKHIYVPAR
jgi:AAA family ATP:ADP antiporter